MKSHRIRGATARTAGGLIALAAVTLASDGARAEEPIRRPVAAPHGRQAVRPRPARFAERPLTIRRRSRPVDVVADEPGFAYVVPQHRWNDPRLYYFGPFRTGGEVFYGDQAGNPITRGNAQMGMISGYGPARGGYGGPHFDAVGGFHNGPGPDAKIDADYASGNLSAPNYGFVPHYPSVPERVASLDRGVVPDDPSYAYFDRVTGRKLAAEGRSSVVAADEAKAAFSAPMRREAPIEAAFANGGLQSAGFQVGNGEF